MPELPQLKPTHKPIKEYFAARAGHAEHGMTHELAVRSAFQRLLEVTAPKAGWHLVPAQIFKVAGKPVRPDGTLRDEFNLHRGYWEAKDSGDKLDEEIRKKTRTGYPLTNTIFEDTQTAVLFQNGKEVEPRFDLTDPQAVCDLLNLFYSHAEPNIEGFEQAVGEFKERVPDLALGLKEKIEAAHKTNKQFQEAFTKFFEVCRQSLNPNLSEAAVDEMLIQHLLTVRLFDKIFNNPDFVRRNVIAAEIEKVIDSLTSKHFDRKEFLKSLDRFYVAIESAAAVLEDFSEKQHFLNTVYERFFQGYSVKVADTHGIVYTPQEIVDFMCASVAEVLEKEFGKTLGSPDVNILDPCTETGTFIVNLIRRVPKRDLPRVYAKQLFANEVMLLPYYISSLNIEHAYYERTGEYDAFEGLCFVDTLDLAEAKQQSFGFMSEENTQRVARQKNARITVIIGNPPYNVGQINENDNNKNRAYNIVDGAIKQTYARDSAASLKTKLYDPYVKFFRWASDRLGPQDGIVCFISNNSFVHKNTFDGMRKHLGQDFSQIYHLDLRGDVKLDPELAGTTYNVFGIQVGVGITIAVRRGGRRKHKISYCTVPTGTLRHSKLAWLAAQESVGKVKWKQLTPDGRNTWLVPENGNEFTSFLSLGSRATKSAKNGEVESVFKTYSLGISTNRDHVVYEFLKNDLIPRVKTFCDRYNEEVDRLKRTDNPPPIDDFVRYDRLKWSQMLKRKLEQHRYAKFDAPNIRHSLYRPFTRNFVFFDAVAVDAPALFPSFIPTKQSEDENRVIVLSDVGYRAKTFSALISNTLADLHLCASVDGHQCFPFYVYSEDGTNRRENITDWALAKFREHYGDKKIKKWDIFYYVYGVLHHPGYREKFADNLKRDLPRVPLAADFRAFATVGKKLAELHLNYEQLEPWPLQWLETEGKPLDYRVEKMRLSKDKTQLVVNDSLMLAGIPSEAFEYRLGNRSVLDWVIDQYRVKRDKVDKKKILSDPNNPDDEEYIVRLVGQVVRVSMETVEIVRGLPAEYAAGLQIRP